MAALATPEGVCISRAITLRRGSVMQGALHSGLRAAREVNIARDN